MEKIKLFITGMGGMAGRALVKQTLKQNYFVGGTIHQNLPQQLKTFTQKGLLKYYSIDLKDLDKAKKTIAAFQPDVVVHLAGKVFGGLDKQIFNPQIYNENIAIFKNILAAVKNLNSPVRFILSSGCLVYDRLTSPEFITEVPIENLPKVSSIEKPYRASKLDQEKLLSESGLDYVIARPTQFTGEGKIPGVLEYYIACEIQAILKGEKKSIHLKNKLGEVDLLDVRDVVRAFLTLIKSGVRGEVYHISSGSPTTVEEVVKVFLEVAGLNPSKFPVISTETEKTLYFRFSSEKLNKLGWRPQFSLKDALKSYWEYFKSQKR